MANNRVKQVKKLMSNETGAKGHRLAAILVGTT
jgi:hypothetical protein